MAEADSASPNPLLIFLCRRIPVYFGRWQDAQLNRPHFPASYVSRCEHATNLNQWNTQKGYWVRLLGKLLKRQLWSAFFWWWWGGSSFFFLPSVWNPDVMVGVPPLIFAHKVAFRMKAQKLKIQSQRIEGALVLDAHCHARLGLPPVNFHVREK